MLILLPVFGYLKTVSTLSTAGLILFQYPHVSLLRSVFCVSASPETFTKNLTTIKWYWINLSKPTGYMLHQQFNIQQLYALSTLYLCVLYLSENKQRLVPLTA